MNVSPPWRRPRASLRLRVSLGAALTAALTAALALGALLAPGARAQSPAAPTLTPTYSFSALGNNGSNPDGSGPQAGLIALGDGYLYGTTSTAGMNPDSSAGSGTVFKVHPDGTGLTVLHTFGAVDANGNVPDGQAPAASLLAPGDGYLYGTTSAGGANADGTAGTGTVFKVRPDGTGFAVLHTFSALSGSSTNNDGANPTAALVSFDGLLAGTAQNGGTDGFGTVFVVSTDGATFNPLHYFGSGDTNGAADGAFPNSALLAPGDGFLYGTTPVGGDNGTGTIFRWGLPNTLVTLHSFEALDQATLTTNAEGANPQAPLIALPDAAGTVFFYGTAAGGGATGNGAVFRFRTVGTATGTTFTPLHSFSASAGNTEGTAPRAALVAGGDGLLYGTTSGGGANGSGTVFRLSPDGMTTPFQTYYTLDPATNDGSSPEAPLLVFGDGFLYGTAQGGGVNGSGAVFQLTGPPVTHLLWNNPDGRTIFWDVNPDGSYVVAGDYPAFQDDASGQTGYRALALSTGPDGVSHMLWNNSVGVTYLWTVQADGSFTPFRYGPFSDDGTSSTIWKAVAVSTGGDNVTHILWRNPNGRTILWDVSSDGTFAVKGNYGPQIDGTGGPGFVPVALASGPDGLSHILWNNADGLTLLWNLDATEQTPAALTYPRMSDDGTNNTIWTARAVSVGPDDVPHLLWNNPNGRTIFWTVHADGSFGIIGNYDSLQEDRSGNTGYVAVSLATGLDNRSHFAWDNAIGHTYLWSVSSTDGSHADTLYGPFSDDGTGRTLWTAAAVSAPVAAVGSL